MNAVSLYVSTSRIILHYDLAVNDYKIADLYRLVPYLRQSMSCAVCGRLLKDPFSPKEAKCQHNVCRLCVRGRKNVRPACNSCKDCQDFRTYEENKQMRILLQCYKSMCEHIMNTTLFNFICKQSIQTSSVVNGIIIPNLSLVELIEEGANFEDIFMAFSTELPKSFTKIIPTVVTSVPAPNPPSPILTETTTPLPVIKPDLSMIDISLPVPIIPTHIGSPTVTLPSNSLVTTSLSSTTVPTATTSPIRLTQFNKTSNLFTPRSTLPAVPIEAKSMVVASVGTNTTQIRTLPPIKTVSNGTAMYSVLYTGIGNKITIKRKTEADDDSSSRKTPVSNIYPQVFKQSPKRRGCRCGNATATPGKLTCCGQRCPCYVDSKSCIGCKCRGCRNPHRPDGGKVRPIIPELACYEIHMADDSTNEAPEDLPIAKDIITSTNRLTPTANFKNGKEYSLNNFPVASRITVTPMMSNKCTIQQRSPAVRVQQQQTIKQPPTFLTTNKVQREQNVVQLENFSKESLLIQSPEGSYQVVNVFTTTSHQNQPTIQRIQASPHNSNGNTFITPNSKTQVSTIHQLPDSSSTISQIFMQQQQAPQQQQHQQLTTNNKQTLTTSTTPVSAFTKHNNLLTVHSVPSHSTQQSKNTTISLPSSSATFTLSPIIVTSPSSFTSELFQDDDFMSSTTSTGDSPLSIASHPPLLEVLETGEI